MNLENWTRTGLCRHTHPPPNPREQARLWAPNSPPREQLGDLGPAVSQQAVGLVDDKVLLSRPRGLLHIGVEVVVPAFSALLAQPALQVTGHYGPLLVAITIYQLYDLNNAGVREHLGYNSARCPLNQSAESSSSFIMKTREEKKAITKPIIKKKKQ